MIFYIKSQVNETMIDNRLLYLLAGMLSVNMALAYTNCIAVYRSKISLLPVIGCERQRTVHSIAFSPYKDWLL